MPPAQDFNFLLLFAYLALVGFELKAHACWEVALTAGAMPSSFCFRYFGMSSMFKPGQPGPPSSDS
jgi:hypothetical protein